MLFATSIALTSFSNSIDSQSVNVIFIIIPLFFAQIKNPCANGTWDDFHRGSTHLP
jgi:hypothetical protein